MSGRVIIISGYFNPLHSGHLDYIEAAKEKGDYLIVIINNDKQVEMKGNVQFMSEEERLRIVSSIKGVDKAVLSIDEDSTVCQTIRQDEKAKLPRPKPAALGTQNQLGVVGGRVALIHRNNETGHYRQILRLARCQAPWTPGIVGGGDRQARPRKT